MPKIEDIFSIERNRQDESSWNKIHLFKTGEFYRAYEYSAWLTAEIAFNDKVRMQTKDRAPLKATRVEIARTNDTVCFVGFPVKSLNKFIPQRTDFAAIDDKHLVATIELPHDEHDITFERLHNAFTTWKNSIELKVRKKKAAPAPLTPPPTPTSEPHPPFGLLSQIMAYEPELHSATENILFISSLKHQISAIL